MGKSAETFRKRLKQAIDSGEVKKIDLHRKTEISRNSIDGYLAGSVPDLDSLDKIAAAMNVDPRELIKPENAPIIKEHTLQDCLAAVNSALAGKPVTVTVTPNNVTAIHDPVDDEIQSNLKSFDAATKKRIATVISLFDKLNEPSQEGLIELMRSSAEGAAIFESIRPFLLKS